MTMTTTTWDIQKQHRLAKLKRAKNKGLNKRIEPNQTISLLETVIDCGDKVCLEGNNQK